MYCTMEIQTLAIGIIFVIIFCIVKHPRVGPVSKLIKHEFYKSFFKTFFASLILQNEPPLVPFTIPILGHTFHYLFDSKNFIQKCKEQVTVKYKQTYII